MPDKAIEKIENASFGSDGKGSVSVMISGESWNEVSWVCPHGWHADIMSGMLVFTPAGVHNPGKQFKQEPSGYLLKTKLRNGVLAFFKRRYVHDIAIKAATSEILVDLVKISLAPPEPAPVETFPLGEPEQEEAVDEFVEEGTNVADAELTAENIEEVRQFLQRCYDADKLKDITITAGKVKMMLPTVKFEWR